MQQAYRPWQAREDRVFHILMIGNSFCQRYYHELYGMARAAGIECRITGVIAGACTLERHWNWCAGHEKPYYVPTLDRDGFREAQGLSLDDCLAMADWNFISYQDGEYYYRLEGLASARAHMEPSLGNLVDYVRQRFPEATHCFHQVWAYQVGYNRPEKSPFRVPDAATQSEMHRDLRLMALEACERHDLLRIPGGDAWAIARADARVGDHLCTPDCEHDGDVGGGQYLNACVWFEFLFGRSCIGNSYRPPYEFAEEKVAALQQAAHRAVAEWVG